MCIDEPVGINLKPKARNVRIARILLNFWLSARGLWTLPILDTMDAQLLNTIQLFLIESKENNANNCSLPKVPVTFASAFSILSSVKARQADILEARTDEVGYMLRDLEASANGGYLAGRSSTQYLQRVCRPSDNPHLKVADVLYPNSLDIQYISGVLPSTGDGSNIDENIVHLILAESEIETVRKYLPTLRLLFADSNFEINTPIRIAYFLGQAGEETGYLSTLTESGSGMQYEFLSSIGNTHLGDGPKFKGRGFIQMTGRDNYTRFQSWMNSNVGQTDVTSSMAAANKVASDLSLARYSSGWFWKYALGSNQNTNKFADADDVTKVSIRVNGGNVNGIEVRKMLTRRARYAIF